MQNSSLIEILKTFSKEEFKKFEDIILSPYYNKKSPVTALFKILKTCFPNFKDEDIEREQIWNKLFPGKKYNYGVMKNLIFELQKLSEKFIELQIYEGNFFEQKKNLLDALVKKELFPLFEKNIKSAKTKLENSQIDQEHYLYLYYFEAKEQSYLYHNLKFKDPNFCNPIPVSKNLSSFFFMNFFGENYNSLFQSKFYNKRYNLDFIKDVSDFFDKSLSKDNEYAKLFLYSLKMGIDQDDDSSFFKLKELTKKNYKKISRKLIFNAGMSLINYCSLQVMKGRAQFLNDQFEVYKLMLDNGLYYGDDSKGLSGIMFANVVSTACAVEQVEWAEKFMEQYKGKLLSAHRKYAIMFANVTVNIKKKNFDQALSHLARANSGDLIQKINIKRFQIMIYYELGYIEELYSFLDASKHFISNDTKASENVKTAFSNFIALVLLLLTYKYGSGKNRVELDIIKKTIESTESPNKLWLMQKVMEL